MSTLIIKPSGDAWPAGLEEAGAQESLGAQAMFLNSTYTIVSKVAYLTGVPRRIFENEFEPPKLEIYEELDRDKNARIVRHLSCLRTALERNYGFILKQMRYELKNLHSLPEYIPQDSLRQLSADGIVIERANAKPTQYIMDINRQLSNRINNCKNIFPIWLKWEYIRSLFLMPNGTTEAGLKAAFEDYRANRDRLPYQVYLNWNGAGSGNIFYNDKKFVTLLYEANEDYFGDLSKVTDAGEQTKDGIYRFLDASRRTTVVVDCENSDPYKLYATLNNLNQEALLDKIVKIILYNDVHTATAWKILDRFTDIPIEHILIERIKENKSLVDMRLAVGATLEFTQNHVDSFILVSSDSDYWGLISTLSEARFFVMIESEKCSPSMKNALVNAGISYCYIDDFCTGNSNSIKVAAVLSEVRRALDESFHLNIQEVLQNAFQATRADMTAAERTQFYNRYIKPMKIVIDENGDASIELGK